MAVVMIGVDPHKGSHTAVAVGADERPLGQVRVRASAAQAKRLLQWATAWPERAWAVEGAGGLGHLLAQQLLAAGEQVPGVQPKLAARVRLLACEAVNKNDPNDARSVAVAALRSPSCPLACPDDHAMVLKIWAKRYRDLGRSRTQVACRLHAALCELVPGGLGKEISAGQAERLLQEAGPSGAAGQARLELAEELVGDLRHTGARISETRKKLATAVLASGTSLTEIFGVGPVVAAIVIGDVRDVSRFDSRDRFAAYNGTAPIEVSSGKRKVHRLSRRGNRRINHAVHMAAVTQIRYPHSGGRAYYDKKLAEGKTPKEALRALKRQVSDAIYKHLKTDSARVAASGAPVREGTRGTTLSPARPAHTPGAGSSAKPLPDQLPPYDQSQGPAKATPAGAACRASSGAGPGLPAPPAPRSRRGSGVKAGRQAVAAGDAKQP